MSERMENVSVWILLSLLLWIAASPAMAAPPVDKPCRGKKCVTPTPTPTPPQVRKVVGGESFTCVLNAGAVKCMGNFEGETNRGAFSNILVPSVVSGLESGVTDISAGPYNLLAIKDGNLYAIGSNDYNQLAQGASYPRDVTSPVLLLSGVKKAAISYYHGCALMQNGEVRCWGSNFYGIFGNGSWSDIPSIADAAIVATNAQDVFVNENATCVLAGQSVQCAGYNGNGDIGVSTPSSDVPTFVNVATLPGPVAEIQSGYFHSCARLLSGESYCWGFQVAGELGYQGIVKSPNYAKLATEIPVDAEAIYVQNYSTCFKKTGNISCVGWNIDHSISSSSSQNFMTATVLQGLHSTPIDMIRDISGQRGGNYAHRCAVTVAGLECWGWNSFGELGDGTTNPVDLPKVILSW